MDLEEDGNPLKMEYLILYDSTVVSFYRTVSLMVFVFRAKTSELFSRNLGKLTADETTYMSEGLYGIIVSNDVMNCYRIRLSTRANDTHSNSVDCVSITN